MSKDNAKEYMKPMFAKHDKGQDSNSNDPDSSEGKSWRRNMNNAKQMHVLASAGINPSEHNIDITNDDL